MTPIVVEGPMTPIVVEGPMTPIVVEGSMTPIVVEGSMTPIVIEDPMTPRVVEDPMTPRVIEGPMTPRVIEGPMTPRTPTESELQFKPAEIETEVKPLEAETEVKLLEGETEVKPLESEIQPKPAPVKPEEGFKIESPFAEVDIVDRPWEECQMEYLAKVKKLKEGGNAAFRAGNHAEAITWYTKGLEFVQRASLLHLKPQDQRDQVLTLFKGLVSNTGKAYFNNKNFSEAYSQFQLVKKLDPASHMPYYKAAQCVRELGGATPNWEAILGELTGGLEFAKKSKSLADMKDYIEFYNLAAREKNAIEAEVGEKMREAMSKKPDYPVPLDDELPPLLESGNLEEPSGGDGYDKTLGGTLLGLGGGALAFAGLHNSGLLENGSISDNEQILLSLGVGAGLTGLVVPENKVAKVFAGGVLGVAAAYLAAKFLK